MPLNFQSEKILILTRIQGLKTQSNPNVQIVSIRLEFILNI
jgi:hypothetical protein